MRARAPWRQRFVWRRHGVAGRWWPLAVCGAASCWGLPPSWHSGLGSQGSGSDPWGQRRRVAARAEASQPEADLQSDPEEILNQLEESGLFRGDEQLLAQLRLLAAEGVHPLDALRGVQQEDPRDPMLQSFDVAGIARYIQDQQCQNIVVLCGAGISTSAGIPDFRTPGSGLYDNLQRFNLTEPESIFNLDFFQKEPGPFYELCRDLWPGHYEPTIGHHFIRLLETKGLLRRCYTQNIDSLERQAGVSPEKIVAAHGNMDEAHVVGTQRFVEVDELRQAIFAGEKGWRALAATHGGLVKPSVVMFGEDLPDRFWDLQEDDLRKCDLMIVIGTSLVVEPFASLVGKASPTAPRLLINREPSGTCDKLLFGFRFHLPQLANWRDVWFEGSCDDGCVTLATALGWEKELRKLQVTVLEVAPEIMGAEDSDAAALIREVFREEGIQVFTNCSVSSMSHQLESSSGGLEIQLTVAVSGAAPVEMVCDALLVATGRTPNIEGLGLDAANVECSSGGVKVKDDLTTSNPDILAIGDVIERPDTRFTHMSGTMAGMAVQTALFGDSDALPVNAASRKLSQLVVPRCTYTEPEVASCGVSNEKLASRANLEVDVFKVSTEHNDRAILEGTTRGYVKILCRKGTEEIVGATIVAEHAGEMLAEITLAIQHGIGLSQIARTVHPYPTLGEAVQQCALNYNRASWAKLGRPDEAGYKS